MNKFKQIHILIDDNFKKEIQEYCKENHTTVSQETKKLWKEKLEKEK